MERAFTRRAGSGRMKALYAVGIAWVVVLVVFGSTLVGASTPASTAAFDSEQPFPGGGAYWEPTIAADPSSSYVYQAVTYINASKTCSGCPGTAVFLRSSSDGGATWGAARPVSLARGRGWQFDPQIKVATDGTVYVVFLQTFNPGSVLFKSTDHGATWSSTSNSHRMSRCRTMPDSRSRKCRPAMRASGGTRMAGHTPRTAACTSPKPGRPARRRTESGRTRATRTASRRSSC